MLRETRKPYSRYIMCAIEAIKQHIDDHPFQFKTATQLFKHLGITNRKYIERAFKHVYRAGIKEYHVRQRLEASKIFLEAGLTKKQVAYKCLYRSQSAFAAAFKKEFNMTPTDWQMNIE